MSPEALIWTGIVVLILGAAIIGLLIVSKPFADLFGDNSDKDSSRPAAWFVGILLAIIGVSCIFNGKEDSQKEIRTKTKPQVDTIIVYKNKEGADTTFIYRF